MQRAEIQVQGMSCDGCVTSVQNALTNRPGVTAANADLETGTVVIDFDPEVIQRASLEEAIEDAGFDVAA
ncbi:MAG: cation transporter [Gammaproteobacteria bacterium]|nr:cation transporter [Gammaproteobacteria bacterium]